MAAKREKEKTDRPLSQAVLNSQKGERKHMRHKEEAKRLWTLLGNPVYDAPLNPETLFAPEAIAIAKRGRRSTMETIVCGSNATKKAIRDHERSALKRGDVMAGVHRLREYPDALIAYKKIVEKVKKRRSYNFWWRKVTIRLKIFYI